MASSSGSQPSEVLSLGTSIYASIVFLTTWFMITPSKWPMFPLGRPASSLFGACLMLIGGVIPFQNAMNIIGANMEVMALLFGLMVVSFFLGKEGLYEKLEVVFMYRCRNAFDLLWRIVFMCGILSAFVTNDAVCIFITPLVVKICQKYHLPGGPFLIALGTSANIGSAATTTGNPQNALIAVKGNIGYLEFAKYMALISLVCLAVNVGCLYLMYFQKLSGFNFLSVSSSSQKSQKANQIVYSAIEEGINEELELEHVSANDNDETILELEDTHRKVEAKPDLGRYSRQINYVVKILTLAASISIFIALFAGVQIGLASFAGGMAVIAFQSALVRYDPHEVITQKIDYGLLLFFAGLFICIEGFNRTGIPEAVEAAIFGGLDMRSPLATTIFVLAVVVASNTLSNVPAVLLIAPFISSLPSDLAFAYWILSAWVTTVAGNFTIIGSAANIIVAERSNSVKFYDVGFWEFFMFGSWSTAITLSIGCIPLYFLLVQ